MNETKPTDETRLWSSYLCLAIGTALAVAFSLLSLVSRIAAAQERAHPAEVRK